MKPGTCPDFTPEHRPLPMRRHLPKGPGDSAQLGPPSGLSNLKGPPWHEVEMLKSPPPSPKLPVRRSRHVQQGLGYGGQQGNHVEGQRN